MQFSNEQLRTLENLALAYDEWIRCRRDGTQFADSLSWKRVGGRDYLYRTSPRTRRSKSLGRRTEANETFAAEYLANRDRLRERRSALESRLRELGALYRALRLPMIASPAGALLREADSRQMLGPALLVVGTNTMAAYEIEAQNRFASGLDATEDCDLTWSADRQTTLALYGRYASPLNELFKAVDASYTVNMERTSQFRNADAYEVEVLAPPSRLEGYPRNEQLRPLELQSQEWLIAGTHVDHVVVDRSGAPARIVAPDPRAMALHKLWLSAQPDRNAFKRRKDRLQGEALAHAVVDHMPRFPLDGAFVQSIPAELMACARQLWPALGAERVKH